MFFTRTILSALLAVAAASSTSAQRIAIATPAEGSVIKGGSNITVEVDRPNTLSASTEVAIVIALQYCRTSSPSSCFAPSELLGTILYHGPYVPKLPSAREKPPYENFTVAIPPTTGTAQLSVVHLSLIGAGPAPFLETQNVTLTIN